MVGLAVVLRPSTVQLENCALEASVSDLPTPLQLGAPMQTARSRASRSSPVAAKRGAEGTGLDGDARDRGTIGGARRVRRVNHLTAASPRQ